MIHAFPCGTLPLDFVGTLRARRNPEPLEKFAAPGDVSAWFMEAGMIDDAPPAGDADLQRAVEVRERIYALLDASLHGTPLLADDVAFVNEVAAGSPVRLELSDGTVRRSGTIADGLGSLARETIAILGSPDAALLRECARPECTQVYLDRSRGHRREWCSMKTCGNRMKATAFRERRREAAA
ncbi:ABATE domain-containing protein [Leifsonia sp. F6_8S_P_1B]|uniref:ABATE domain-containing protein n=1 Tax=Leifsonia williamsii TaxID=3035919 RepID=A0ABT8K9H5_9MICO|nr:ABATE domain-containing protein [Leifsonia williamsii]MDN4614115.1 ABATE domain-containing protein [Leifsonia williamsii]